MQFSNEIDAIQLVETASYLSRECHLFDKYGVHNYFDYHIMHVYNRVLSDPNVNNVNDVFNLSIIALLHDVVEDHDIELSYIKEIFGERVANGVDAITFKKGFETRNEYYERCKQNPDAKIVKFHDASENKYNCELDQNTRGSEYYQTIIEMMRN